MDKEGLLRKERLRRVRLRRGQPMNKPCITIEIEDATQEECEAWANKITTALWAIGLEGRIGFKWLAHNAGTNPSPFVEFPTSSPEAEV